MECPCCKLIESVDEELAGYQKRLSRIRATCQTQRRRPAKTAIRDLLRARAALRRIYKLAGGKLPL